MRNNWEGRIALHQLKYCVILCEKSHIAFFAYRHCFPFRSHALRLLLSVGAYFFFFCRAHGVFYQEKQCGFPVGHFASGVVYRVNQCRAPDCISKGIVYNFGMFDCSFKIVIFFFFGNWVSNLPFVRFETPVLFHI